MPVNIVKNKTEWNNDEEFLQSWDYGNFLENLGRKILRLSVQSKDGKTTPVQGVIYKMKPMIKYAYFPRVDINANQLSELSEYLKKDKIDFIRIEPKMKIDLGGFNTHKVMNRQTPYTLILDIDKSEEEILKKMHSKTRYNIRLSKRKGVTVKEEINLDVFWDLYKITTERNGFRLHPKNFFEKLLKQNFTTQLTSYFNDKALSTSIVLKHDNKIYYFFGASGNFQRNLMAPYLMHWEIIKWGKRHGCDKYDLFGMAKPLSKEDEKAICFHNMCWDSTDPLSSVTRFKAGFGGNSKIFGQAFDLVLNEKKYKLHNLIRRIKGNPVPVGHPQNNRSAINF
ncbi:MAG: peptidoglycan bridge formation glycyltransferase FemA/FemB family protein [Candidatus Magasanikbacteria bacterium]|nr:peptidoglycan bridge formation glycyltransferase FemA/FemB family protein [Candidatus Magasanikbacteria bacterium]